MAIFHLTAKVISRSGGRSVVAAASYRAAEKIPAFLTGEIHDYSRKAGVVSADVVMPSGSDWMPSRAELWNAVEAKNKRADAVLAREFEIALPQELTDAQRRELAISFSQEIADRYKVAVDVALHAPKKRKSKDEIGQPDDNRNYHAHILITTNRIEGQGFGNKARELDAIAHQRQDKSKPNEVDYLRERFCFLQNQALEKAGHSVRVDHRTLEAQGIDREPGSHHGPAVTAILDRGGVSDVVERIKSEGENPSVRKRRNRELGPSPVFMEYVEAKKAFYAAVKTEKTALLKRQQDERKELAATQKAERKEAYERSDSRAAHSVRAAQQAAARLEMRERQTAERLSPAFPGFKDWHTAQQKKDHPPLVLKGNSPSPALPPRDIRAFAHTVRGQDVVYTSAAGASFVDRGRQIDVNTDHDKTAILAALQLASQKWGEVSISGTDEYKATCVRLAAEHGFRIKNLELQEAITQAREDLRNGRTGQDPARDRADTTGASPESGGTAGRDSGCGDGRDSALVADRAAGAPAGRGDAGIGVDAAGHHGGSPTPLSTRPVARDGAAHQRHEQEQPRSFAGGARPQAPAPRHPENDGGLAGRDRPQPVDVVAKARPVDSGGSADRRTDPDWAIRFKRDSAAKRRADLGEGDGGRAASVKRHSSTARTVDPTDALEAAGFRVKRVGRYLSVRDGDGDERYRVNQDTDGHYVACDKYGGGVGDNVALIRDAIPGLSYPDALDMLNRRRAPAVAARHDEKKKLPQQKPFTMPDASASWDDMGRRYLRKRQISEKTIKKAEAAGMVRFTQGAVVFVGRDQRGQPKSGAMRSIENPLLPPPWKGDRNKSNRAGIKTSAYTPVLPGDPSQVWLVEGGVDALAVHDLHERAGLPVPTVIVTNGCGNRSFITAADGRAREVLAAASTIRIALDRELDEYGYPDDEKQARTNAAHEDQGAAIQEEFPDKEVRYSMPPPQNKDLAEMLLKVSAMMSVGVPLGAALTECGMNSRCAADVFDSGSSRQKTGDTPGAGLSPGAGPTPGASVATAKKSSPSPSPF